MAVEQAAFVTCNSFRLLEVFNRHVKLKEEEACRKEREREWRQKRENRDITEDENRQREYRGKKCRHMHTRTRK